MTSRAHTNLSNICAPRPSLLTRVTTPCFCAGRSHHRCQGRLPPQLRYRVISAIRVERPVREAVPGRVIRPPQFQIPVDGFWRAFKDIGQVGKACCRPSGQGKDMRTRSCAAQGQASAAGCQSHLHQGFVVGRIQAYRYLSPAPGKEERYLGSRSC